MITHIIKMLRNVRLLAYFWGPSMDTSFAAKFSEVPGLSEPQETDRAVELDCRVRWERHDAGRYYEAVVQRDLFGGWELWRCWGGIGSPRGGQRSDPAPSEQAGHAALHLVALRRQRRGYKLTRGRLA